MTEHEFFLSVGGRLLSPEVTRGIYGSSWSGQHYDFGWDMPGRRTRDQEQAHAANMANIPDLKIRGSWKLQGKRYCLWKAWQQMGNVGHFPYNWQVTGSCVGAGGGNMAKTLMALETVAGNMEYRELFWLFTYGKSRERDGSKRPGEGSTGSSYAAAATQDGYVAFGETGEVPAEAPRKEDWIQFPSAVEMKWSDGTAAPRRVVDLAKVHLIKAVAKVRNSDDAVAALANGYPITQASTFGFSPMAPAPKGDPPVRLAIWNGSWSHQTYIDEFWEHPTHGLIFRWGNNWGPGAHGSPTADEPPGGVYIGAKTLDSICRDEVFSFSGGISGFPAQSIPWIFGPAPVPPESISMAGLSPPKKKRHR